ncbi:tRNA (adenosine(37)-N6)-threonylcarbamoyltransferase complex dimerization subunit type 1 TsaB [Hazenella sp. IB182357]|uniref:tRNA (Adenosine(37)-N6)-threonylcarbamoyltransferase complex dimerization subunit type 1 TsaB n=1 Tax=Polycladospora coralii TaxID=2771432 RepID=A0A926N606_9BACL|nr:tRNA (adenosine(37)-N6)-threonylcarbamoyltransferase complex dimerization subunit type 1 TsaB [Polycladospora coralii]
MKLLAMDTSTLVMSVAVLDVKEQKVLGEVTTNLHKNHSIRLMPTIDQLLQDLDLTIQDIALLAVTSGPGSYTGLRIGITTAKTMAWARNIPLYSVSSLSVLARNAVHFKGVIVPIFDARRERAYTGAYRFHNRELKAVLPEQVVGVDAWLSQLKELDEPILFLGDDVVRFRSKIEQTLGDQAIGGSPYENIPRASVLGESAYRRWLNHQPAERINFAPNYLQVTEAEANWLKKQKNGENRDESAIER